MLLLLRKIRRKLMEKNKVTTYLLYAIGEIFLVVIGILIAVSINNWNGHRASYARQTKQLQLIHKEMVTNRQLLSIEWDALEVRLGKQLQFINVTGSQTSLDTMSELTFAKLWYASFNLFVRTPIETAALDELISSGGLKEIRNDSIRNRLASWNAVLFDLKRQEKRIEESHKYFDDVISSFPGFSFRHYITTIYPDRGISRSTNQKSNKQIALAPEFDNAILKIHGQSSRMSNTIFPQYQTHLESMIKMLDEELGRSGVHEIH